MGGFVGFAGSPSCAKNVEWRPSNACLKSSLTRMFVCVSDRTVLSVLYLGDKAFRVDWRVFPVQPQFDGDLGDLADDANNADNTKRVGHMHVSLRQLDEIARPVRGRRGS